MMYMRFVARCLLCDFVLMWNKTRVLLINGTKICWLLIALWFQYQLPYHKHYFAGLAIVRIIFASYPQTCLVASFPYAGPAFSLTQNNRLRRHYKTAQSVLINGPIQGHIRVDIAMLVLEIKTIFRAQNETFWMGFQLFWKGLMKTCEA